MATKTIERYLCIATNAISRTDSTLGYERTIEAIIKLAEVVHSSETDEGTWELEANGIVLGSLLVGAYWHFSDYHNGQGSDGYRALSIIGQIYNPGCAKGPEPETAENDIYTQLESMVKQWTPMKP